MVSRKRIVLLAMSPNRSRLLVLGHTKNFRAPNSVEDWPAGKKLKSPALIARALLHNSMLGVLKERQVKERVLLPSGAFCYQLASSEITDGVEVCNRVRKHLRYSGFECERVYLHPVENLRSTRAFEVYDSLTIEAVQTIFGVADSSGMTGPVVHSN